MTRLEALTGGITIVVSVPLRTEVYDLLLTTFTPLHHPLLARACRWPRLVTWHTVLVHLFFFLAAEYAIAAICSRLRFLPAGLLLFALVSSAMFLDTDFVSGISYFCHKYNHVLTNPLKYWTAVRYYVSMTYGLSIKELDAMLWMHDEPYLTIRELREVFAGSDGSGYVTSALIREGWISVVTETPRRLHSLSPRGHQLVRDIKEWCALRRVMPERVPWMTEPTNSTRMRKMRTRIRIINSLVRQHRYHDQLSRATDGPQ
jgi:hypothetical protein